LKEQFGFLEDTSSGFDGEAPGLEGPAPGLEGEALRLEGEALGLEGEALGLAQGSSFGPEQLTDVVCSRWDDAVGSLVLGGYPSGIDLASTGTIQLDRSCLLDLLRNHFPHN
jgi:hypothetical protein